MIVQRSQRNVLYISYDGMTDPLGQSQVLSYLHLLSEKGIAFDLISFEKRDKFNQYGAEIRDKLKDSNINWHPLVYHKSPPVLSTLYDIWKCWSFTKGLFKKKKIDAVHCRGYIAALIGVKAKSRFGCKFIFDMRGWWADEKLEGGYWKNPVFRPIYKFFKRKEKEFFQSSDFTVSLTNAGKEEIIKKDFKKPNEVVVIPTCVNFNVFKEAEDKIKIDIREKLNIDKNACVLIYSGSLGGNYKTDVVVMIFKKLLELNENATLLILTHSDPKIAWHEVEKYKISKDKVKIHSAIYKEVSDYLIASDIGIVFYREAYSVIGRSPTKLGEYWASGLPVISSEKIGDVGYLMKTYPEGGVVLSDADSVVEYEQVLNSILNNSWDKERIRKAAEAYFSLERGVELYYNKIYSRL